ncbi:MAG TPA: hypothetical protein PLV55_10290 [Anaerohalosphaeraceae bacterium]|nr:hypothetical protein [Anaerohalosphaeraceae bacterium]
MLELVLAGLAILEGVSVVLQGQAAKRQGKAEHKAAVFNAKQQEALARQKLEQAKFEAERQARQQRMYRAANIARAAKSGVSLSGSSYVDILADMAYQFHLDRNLLLGQGMADYTSLMNQASLLRAEGAFAKAQGRVAARSALAIGMGKMALGGLKAYHAGAGSKTGTGDTDSSG